MNREQLNHCYDLHIRLNRAYGLLENIQAKADKTDQVGNLAIAIDDLKKRINRMEDEAANCDEAVAAFANTIEDERISTAIQMRFISGLPWPAVADVIGVSENPLKRLFYDAIPE